MLIPCHRISTREQISYIYLLPYSVRHFFAITNHQHKLEKLPRTVLLQVPDSFALRVGSHFSYSNDRMVTLLRESTSAKTSASMYAHSSFVKTSFGEQPLKILCWETSEEEECRTWSKMTETRSSILFPIPCICPLKYAIYWLST